MKKQKKNKKIWKISKHWWKFVLPFVVAGVLIVAFIAKDLPSPRDLSAGDIAESSQIFDRSGKLLYELYAEENRVSVPLSQIPDNLKEATLAIEDANFYKHVGFDLKGITRGFINSIFKKKLQGGSTLTQQLVKNGLLTQQRTISRKIKEAVLTVGTEIIYSKDQILEMYFNQTPYGGTIYGAQAAARGIFGKDVKDLSLAEAALLAGLPQSPTNYSPFSHPELAKKRQEQVLSRMKELSYITAEEYEAAKSEVLKYTFTRNAIKAPHFVFYVKDQLVNKYGIDKVNAGGLKVTTTLDLALQDYVQETVASEIAKVKKLKVTNGAAIVADPKTGQILAMVGSKDYFAEDIDGKWNVTTASRQPGSSIKPLNYAVGIELGNITAASVLNDSPSCFEVENQKPYCPTNYGNHYFGIQTVRNTLANSLNIGAVKVLKLNGVETFIASASAMGLNSLKDPAQYGLSLTLGGGEVKMTEMVTAFGVFANSGIKQELTPILKVTDKTGNILDEFQYIPGDRVLSRETAFIIQQILSDDGARGMVFGRGSMLNIKGHPEVAVKTGTTNDLRDNWTIGFTPDYVVSVWVGNNDNSKMNGLVSGTTGAAPIWNKVMNFVIKDKPSKKMPIPQNVIGLNVCNLTGMRPPAEGCESHFEYFKKDKQPGVQDNISRKSVLINKDTGKVVKPEDNLPNTEWQEHTILQDAAGEMVCLDCPVINATPTPQP